MTPTTNLALAGAAFDGAPPVAARAKGSPSTNPLITKNSSTPECPDRARAATHVDAAAAACGLRAGVDR
jgi:hypothetical protein